MKTIVYINFGLTIIIIGALFYLFILQKSLLSKISSAPLSTALVTTGEVSSADTCGQECQKQIDEKVSLALSTNSAQPQEVVKTVTITPAPASKKTETSYIPISGPITTTSSNWYDAPGTDFYLDINNDYGKNAVSSWEAYLKVAHDNGVAYARLYDATHGIAVNGSEVSLSNNSNLTRVSSGNLSFWAGRNLYRVQIKSLNTFEVTFGSGKVKITY